MNSRIDLPDGYELDQVLVPTSTIKDPDIPSPFDKTAKRKTKRKNQVEYCDTGYDYTVEDYWELIGRKG